MTEKKHQKFFRGDKISPFLRMVIFVGISVLLIVLIIIGICILQLRPKDKNTEKLLVGIDEDFSVLIGERDEDQGFYEEYPEIQMDLGKAFTLYEENKTYYHECTVTTVGSDGTRLERIKRILRDGDKYNIRTYNKNTLIETIICDGETVVIINETTEKRNKAPLSEFTAPMELASMPSHDNLLSLIAEYDGDKENSILSDASFNISRSRDMNILEINIKYRDTGIEETYLYYLNYGIIYSCNSKSENGKSSPYVMETTYFNRDISDYISENTFNVN